MLVTIIDSKSYGKFVLHKYPYQKASLEQQGLQRTAPGELQQAVTNFFDYFGIYRKRSLIPTANGPLPEKAIVEMFVANEKNSQIVLGIDDDCVLVSRSGFLQRSHVRDATEVWASDNAQLSEVGDEQQSIVNSISLVWRLENYEGVEEAKHRLSFLLGVLQRKEQHSQFLTKEIIKIMEEKVVLKRRIKDLLAFNNKDQQNYEEIRIKILAREIQAYAKRVRERIPIFQLLREYHESWIAGKSFEVKEDEGIWEGIIGKSLDVSLPKKGFGQSIQQKTLAMLPPKVADVLPSVLYSERVKRLYEKGFSYNQLSFRKLLQRSGQMNRGELLHTVHFLLRNNLAVDIYPINYPNSYNIFYLKNLPSRSSIDKFNHRIFPNRNFFQVIAPYSNYKHLREQEETLKYLLLKDLVGEVKIYIYRKSEKESDERTDLMLEQLLSKYNMSQKDLNYLLSVQPFTLSKDSSLLSNIFKFAKDKNKFWGFYFVQ